MLQWSPIDLVQIIPGNQTLCTFSLLSSTVHLPAHWMGRVENQVFPANLMSAEEILGGISPAYLFLFYLFLTSTRVKELILESTIILLASDTSQVERAQSPLPAEVCSLSQYTIGTKECKGQ